MSDNENKLDDLGLEPLESNDNNAVSASDDHSDLGMEELPASSDMTDLGLEDNSVSSSEQPQLAPSEPGMSQSKKELIGTTGGALAGYATSKALGNKALEAIAADMGATGDLVKKYGPKLADKKAKELAQFALDKDIYGMTSGPKKQASKLQDLLGKIGGKQSDLYESVSAKKTPIEEILQNYQSKALPKLSSSQTEQIAAYQNTLDRLNSLKQGIQPSELEKSLGTTGFSIPPKDALSLEELQNQKEIFSNLSRDNRIGLVKNNPLAEQLDIGAKTARETIDKRVLDAIQNGTADPKALESLKNINKEYGLASDLQPGIYKMAAKQMNNASDIVEQAKDIAWRSGKRGVLKAIAKGASGFPFVGTAIGAALGGIGGALATEPGESRLHGAARGAVESLDLSGSESLANAESLTPEEKRQMREDAQRKNASQGAEAVLAMTSKNDYTPQDLQMISEKALSHPGGESYANVLNQAANASERTRQSIMFGLNQQPAFRELLRKLQNNE